MKPRPSDSFGKILSRHTLSPRTANLITILFLILLPPVFFWRETLGWLTLGDQDTLFWFFPIYKQVAEQIRAGHLPLWNPYVYSGMPLFAQPQAGVLDPINWIYLLGTTSRTLTLAQESSFAIALLAAYSYARRLGWKRRACVVTAVIYAFSGFAVARTIYPGLLHIFALTPLPLFFIERLYQCGGKWRDVVPGSLIIAWQVFAGHPQPFLYSSMLAGSYALFCAFFRQAENAGSAETDGQRFFRFRFLFRCAAMYLAGVGLSAVQLLPAAEFARQSVRSEWTYEMFTAHSLHPLSLLTVLFPYFHGNGRRIYHLPFWGNYWHHNEAQIYLGALALSLAATGLFCAWRARFRPGLFWGGGAAAAVLLSLGKYVPPLAHLIYQIPVLNGFRSPNRHWMEVTLAAAVLAGYGVDYLLRRPESCEGKDESSGVTAGCANISAGVVALFSAGVGLFALTWREKVEAVIRKLPDLNHLSPGFLKEAGAEFYLPVILAAAAWLTILVFTRRARARRWYPLLLLALLTDFGLYAVFAPISNPKNPELFIGQAIPAEISAENNELPRYHVLLAGPSAGDFAPDWFYGHEMATGYDPLVSARYKTFSGIDEAGHSYITSLVETRDCTLDLLSVRYVLVPKTLYADHQNLTAGKIRAALNDPARWQKVPGITPRIDQRDYEVYRNLRSLPRAWIVERIDAAFEGDQLKIIRGEFPAEQWRGFDPRHSALAEPEVAERLSAELQPDSAGRNENAYSEITGITRQNQHSLRIDMNATRPVVLVLSEIVFPGWRAQVDGKSTSIYRLNYALHGIVVQPGTHRIELIYRPDSLLIGAAMSVATALLLFSLILSRQRHGHY